MTRDDILRMARDAGFVDASFCRWSAYSDDLERFAALVAAAEREECAKVCEARNTRSDPDTSKERLLRWEAYECAKAIRARGQHE